MERSSAGGQPVYILKEGTQRTRGMTAQENNILAATSIADVVRTTLGPKGMDKMLVEASGDAIITNDGATILQTIDVAHPAAKVIAELAKAQDSECGDGTKSTVILAGELLRQARKLLEEGIHSTHIQGGYARASKEALRVLEANALPIGRDQPEILRHIAKTSLFSKNVGHDADLISDIAAKACAQVAEGRDSKMEVDLDNILVRKAKGHTLEDTALVQGIILDKERVHTGMPRRVQGARLALLDVALEVKKTEVSEEIHIREPGQLEAFVAQEEKGLRDMVAKVQKSGANVLVCQKGIDDLAQHHLAKAGIYAVPRTKKSDMEKLAKATGATIVTTLDDLSPANLGKAGLVEERRIEEEKFTFVTECASPKAVSILIRGSTQHVLDEAERALHDALSVVSVGLKDGKMLPGGGAAFTETALRLRDYAATIGGREQLSINAYAEALESIPTALAENAGLDELDVLLILRQAHKKGDKNAGLNVSNGKVEDMVSNHVVEPLRVPAQEIKGATEAAIMVLRIDDVIAAKPFTPPAGKPGPSE